MTFASGTPPARTQCARLGLFATAFITGAVVMALEILGSRLLAPVFGNSLFVWGALIGVILAAMSSGYAAGGWLSDRYPGGAVLAWLLLASGAWTFLIAWKGHPVMFAVADWIEDPRWGPCLAASILLSPPAFGLSGVLPALLRLSIADMGHLGRNTGGMIAVSTVGSLIGTWGTAFFLLTWMGSIRLVALLGGVQVLLGFLWWVRAVAPRALVTARSLTGLVLAVAALGLGWLALHPDLVLPAPLYQEDSPYQQIRVRDTQLLRYLILDRTFHAVMWRSEPVELFLPYSHVMVAALALSPHPQRALILGHGGGSLAKWLARYWPALELDIVEVDPSVVRVAETFFDYHPPANHHIHVKDARAFLRSTAARYDVIWLDVFARHLIPFHLTTREFFELVRAHLNPDGVLAANLASTGDGPDRQRAEAVVETLRSVFPVIESFGAKGSLKTTKPESENLIFFAGSHVMEMREPEFFFRVTELVANRLLPGELLNLLAIPEKREWHPGVVLTDDYAPFDLLIGRGAAGDAPTGLVQPQGR
jgi:spermidine synthase